MISPFWSSVASRGDFQFGLDTHLDLGRAPAFKPEASFC